MASAEGSEAGPGERTVLEGIGAAVSSLAFSPGEVVWGGDSEQKGDCTWS